MPPSPSAKPRLTAAFAVLAGMGTAALLLPAPERGRLADSVSRFARPPSDSPLGRSAPVPVPPLIDFVRNAGTPAAQVAAALRLAALDDPQEIRTLLEHAHLLPSHSAGTIAVGTLLKRWLELEADEAAVFCRTRFPAAFAGLVGTLALTDPDKAAALAMALPDSAEKTQAWQEICSTAASAGDSEKAWALLAAFPTRSEAESSTAMKGVLDLLVSKDPEGSIARLSRLPSALLRSARVSIAGHLAVTDPDRGWEWVLQQPHPNALLCIAIQQALHRDPAEALARLATLPASRRKQLQSGEGHLWECRAAAALAAALAQTTAFPSAEKQEMARKLLENCAWLDPVGAGAFLPLLDAADLDRSAERYLHIREYLTNADDTKEWVGTLPPDRLGAAASEAWQRLHRPEPAGPADQAGMESLRRDFTTGVSIREDHAGIPGLSAAGLGEMLGQDPHKNHYARKFLAVLAKTKPGVAAEWLATVPLNEPNGMLAAHFISMWAQEDPASAGAWARSLPPGDLGVNAATNVARQYHRYDPAAGAAWLASLPAGEAKEVARYVIEHR